MDKRFDYLYRMCIACIGIPGGTKVPSTDTPGTKVPPGGMEPIRKYYPNSIEEYRYLLALGNKSGSRTEQAKKIKSAESAVRFLQYVKLQGKFMEFLLKVDPITYMRIPIYSNPSILKGTVIRKSDIAIPVNPKDTIEKA